MHGDSSTYTVPLGTILLHIIGWYVVKHYFLTDPSGFIEKTTLTLFPWCTLLSILSISLTSFTDPGIYVLNPDPLFRSLVSTGTKFENLGEKGHIHEDPVTGQRYIFKCNVCRVFKKLNEEDRALGEEVDHIVHCESCDTCIVGYDHHCGVLGACVGKKNLWYFHAFPVFLLGWFAMFYLSLLSCLTDGFGYAPPKAG